MEWTPQKKVIAPSCALPVRIQVRTYLTIGRKFLVRKGEIATLQSVVV
jgi:hypothetical protein